MESIMKITDLEGVEALVTKKDLQILSAELRTEMEKSRSALLEYLLVSERGQMNWIWGLYALVLVIAGAQWAGVMFILHSGLKP